MLRILQDTKTTLDELTNKLKFQKMYVVNYWAISFRISPSSIQLIKNDSEKSIGGKELLAL